MDKICLIGFPRSRSSFFLEALSMYYNMRIELSAALLHEKFMEGRFSEDQFKLLYVGLIERLNKSKDRLVTRYHPNHLSFSRNKKFELSSIFDFNIYNFKQYCKIYVTQRSTIDRVCSVAVADRLKIWTYANETQPKKNLESFTIDENNNKIGFSIIENIIFETLEEYFKNNSITYEVIDYNDVILYSKKNNFPIHRIGHIETNYDYSKIISNYSDVENYIKDTNLKIRSDLGLIK